MLTLVMMVRNEGAVIQRALDSAMSRCDAAFIVDTGSTDHTVTAAVEYLDAQRCPYRIVHRTWVDFAVNRTQALQLAAQYYPEGHLLVLDADDRWEGNVSGLTGDVYDIVKASGSIEFAYPHIFSAKAVNDGLIRYRGVTHEFVDIDPSCSHEVLKSPRIICGGGGSRAPYKHAEDIALLTDALKHGDEPDLAARYHFYLAQAYRLTGDHNRATQSYEAAIKAKGWVDEQFYSHLMLGNLGRLPAQRMWHYLQAYELSPERPEPFVELAAMMRSGPEPMRHSAYQMARNGYSRTKTRAPFGLFADVAVWQWRACYELSIAAYYAGDMVEGRLCCERLLLAQLAPRWALDATFQNLALYQR